jgi:putative transposase
MPRIARAAPGGYVYHALDRAVARLPLFEKEADFAAFERVLEAVRRSAQQGRPYGGARWQKNAAIRLGLEYTLRPRGRPRQTQ